MKFRNWLESQATYNPEERRAAWTTLYNCDDCGQHVAAMKEYAYMLRNEIWKSIGSPDKLCVGCVEKRLGRRLQKSDFEWSWPLTSSSKYDNQRSERLLDRMGKTKPEMHWINQ